MSLLERLNGPVGNGRGTSAAGDQSTSSQHGTQGLIQLCVIVAKDEVGYGLTVSGDKPVHVQSVKENGASAKAGVRTGDRIYKVNGAAVANCDHTEVVNLIKSGSQVALTLLRKPEKDQNRMSRVPISPGGHNVSIKSGGSDKITNPMPADAKRRKSTQALQEQMVAKERIDTVRRMYEESLGEEMKLQQEYGKTKSQKTEAKLQDAKKTTGAIKQQLESLTSISAPDMRSTSSRNSICLGDFHSTASDSIHSMVGTQRPLKASWSIPGPFSSRQPSSPRKLSRSRNMSVKRSNSDSVRKSSLFSQQAVSMPASVDHTDSSILRQLSHSTIGETSVVSDDTDDEGSLRRLGSFEPRDSISNPRSDIFSMEEEDFSPESQTVVKDHGPFVDFDQLRNKHAHCSVFLSFLLTNGDPASMLFTLTSEIYTSGTIKDMKRWAYEIHSTFIIKDAPLDIKLDDSIVEAIDTMLKQSPEKEDPWKNIFNKAKMSAREDVRTALADFRQKRELGLGNFFGDGLLKDAVDKTAELRIVERTLRPHYDKFCNDADSVRSQALSLSLATVMKEWGVHKGGIDRQLSFAMKDLNKSGLKSMFGGKFKTKQKDIKSHVFNPHVYYSTTFCEQCGGLIWGIGFQGYTCSNCEMNIHKECINGVDVCKKKKKKRTSMMPRPMQKTSSSSSTKFHVALNPSQTVSAGSLSANLGLVVNVPPKRSQSFGSAAMMTEELKDTTSPTNDEDVSGLHSVAKLKERFEMPTQPPNGEQTKANVGRSGSFHKKSDSVKSKDGRRAKSDVDKDGGKIVDAINASRSSSSASSLSNRSDSSSNERVNDLSVRAASIDEEGDSDLEVEDSMPPLDSVIRKELIRKMKPKEKKLQEVINELLYTEKSHVRNLKILDLLFHRPMFRAEYCSKELVELVFPDIKSLIDVHVQLNNEMKAKMKEDPLVSIKHVAQILLNRFDHEAGDRMKECCAVFCRNHTYALSALRAEQKRDTKLQELVASGEANPKCRRLYFKDLLISEVHRLTKYPLLIDSMCNHTASSSEEHRLLARASRCSRNILAHVNQAVKDTENHHKLLTLQKKLDVKPIQNSANPLVADFKNLNLQEYKLVYEGALTWRLRAKQIDLHVILFEQMLVLLQVQDDGRLVLKCQSQIATTARDDSKFGHSPIITLNSMLVRQVATDKKAIFIINTSQLGPQIYDLVANSVEEKKRWFKYITEAADSQKRNTTLTIRRPPVNNSKLTLTEVNQDEPCEEKLSDAESTAAQQTNATTNNNIESEIWPDSTPSSNLLLDTSASESDQLDNKETGEEKADTEVSTSKNSQDDDGERDAKSLVLASISDTALLKQFLSATATNTLNAAPPPSPLSPSAASKQELSQAAAAPEQTLSVLNTLSRRLNSLLEKVEEHENERARLQHQLQAADQLLRDGHKDLVDSRPNSFVSSSSSASVGEATDSQPNAMSAVIEQTQPLHSAPINSDINNSTSLSGTGSDSDDEGTVYDDTKEDFGDASEENKQSNQRPDSSLSNVSTSLTDNTLVSTDNLSDDIAECIKETEHASDDIQDVNVEGIPHIEVNSASSSNASSDSEIEHTNIDDIVADTNNSCNVVGTDSDSISDSEMTAAASIVEEAMKAAIDIIRAESEENVADSPVDCSYIEVDLVPDAHAETGGIADSDIDDSDEADALSASSLD